MDKELFDIKIKRCFAQYEYLETELVETEYLFDMYRKKFIDEYYGGNIPVEELRKPITEEEKESEIIPEPEKPAILKKIYKSLSLKTHPDKTGGDESAFVAVKKAYNEGNVFKLLTIATKMNIDFTEIKNDSVLELYEQNIKETQEKIENYKKRAAWVWAFANDEQKAMLRNSL